MLNVYGGAAPGNITMSGSGTLTLSGATTNYPATITVSCGVLSLAPTSGNTASYAGTPLPATERYRRTTRARSCSGANGNFGGSVAINAGQLTVNTPARNRHRHQRRCAQRRTAQLQHRRCHQHQPAVYH